MTPDTRTSRLTTVPYAERQLVVVMPDDVAAAARQAQKRAARKETAIDWKDVAVVAIQIATGSVVSTLLDVTIEALSAWAKARQSGLNVLEVSRTEANELTFPPGHPRDGVLYVGHPAVADVDYTMASFHRVAFEHKFAEATDLLMNLGASELKVEHVRGWSREFSSKLSIPLAETSAASGSAGASAKQSATLLYEATLQGHDQPTLPEYLVWYPHEPTWQSIAKGRLDFGLKQFSLTVNYDDDFGVNAGLRLGAQKVGLELGGAFEDHEATSWRIVGKFGAVKL